jgi:poly(A) polymerase
VRPFDLFTAELKHLHVVETIERNRLEGAVFLVGGAIREVALEKEPKDYDFALERQSDVRRLERSFGARSFVLGKKPIQTQRIVSGNVSIDLTILQVDIEEDLPRRDLTINAMAYDIKRQQFLDPLGGLNDIERKVLRFPRRESIREDPLRMVKAVRHLATLRGFSLDPELKAAIKTDRKMIHRSASERIKYELDLILASNGVYKAVRTMEKTGLLFELVPELERLREMDREKGFELETLGHTITGFKYLRKVRKFYRFTAKDVLHAAYALLFHDLGKANTFSYDEEKERVHFFYHERYSKAMAEKIMERLRFSTSDARTIAALIEHHMRLFLISRKEATEKATRRAVYKLGDLVPPLVLLSLLDMYGSSRGQDNESTGQVRERCREVLKAYEEWKKEPLAALVTGHNLITLGYEEGPRLGRVLQEIREKQIAGEIATAREAMEYAKESLKQKTDSGKAPPG